MKTNRTLKICLLTFVFLCAFSIGAQLVRSQIEYERELERSPVTQYLRENYGVDTVEQYQVKLEQEAWLNYTQTLKQLNTVDSEWLDNLKQSSLMPQFGTSAPAYQPKPTLSEALWFNLASVNPMVELSVFSLSGIGFLAMTATPFVKNRKKVRYALALVFVCFVVFGVGFFVGQIFASSSVPNVYLDQLPSTASYVISTDGTNVWATRYDGKIAFS